MSEFSFTPAMMAAIIDAKSGIERKQVLRYVAFIRHIGCPFSEQTVKLMHKASICYPHVSFTVVSHGATEKRISWLKEIGDFNGLIWIDDTKKAALQRILTV